MEDRYLTLITEGHIAKIDYFFYNKIYFKNYVTDLSKCVAVLPFLTENDDILLVINGLTDFNRNEIFSLIQSITSGDVSYGNFTLMSNLYFENLGIDYYLYKGDLLRGDVLKITNKITRKEVNNFLKDTVVQKTDLKNNERHLKKTNAVMERYLGYKIVQTQLFLKDKVTDETKDFIDSGIGESVQIKLSKIYDEK